MFKIVRRPSQRDSFFDSLKSEFHWGHFIYFRWIVLLMVFGGSPKILGKIVRRIHEEKVNEPGG